MHYRLFEKSSFAIRVDCCMQQFITCLDMFSVTSVVFSQYIAAEQ